MSIRIKIAKWLAPDIFVERAAWEEAAKRNFGLWVADSRLAIQGLDALRKIASQRTAGANSTVKRMADIADAALKIGEPK